MFITDRFVFTHPPKTGGSFVTDVLLAIYGESQVAAPKHAARCDIPDGHKSKPVLTLIREPLAYYTSVWRYGWWIDRDPGDWHWSRWDERWARDRFANYPYLTFAEFVEAVLSIERRYLPAEVKAMAGTVPIGQLLLSTLDYACTDPVTALREQASQTGLSTLRRHLEGVTFLHTENLGPGLRRFLVRQGVPRELAEAACSRVPIRPVNTPAGQVLKKGHGQRYDAGDRGHLTPPLVAKILAAEEIVLRMFSQYRAVEDLVKRSIKPRRKTDGGTTEAPGGVE